MYAERISTFRGVIGGANAAADVTEISGQLLSMLERVDNVFRMEKMYVIGQGLAPVMESLLDELRSSLAQGGNLPLLTWVRWAAGEVAQSLENSGTPKSALDQLLRGFAAELRELAMRANVMMDYWSISRDRDEILKQAREAVKEAQQSASKAKMSAGITGEAKLSEHFGSYASGEKTAANGFRIAAIASVVLAFIVAIAFGPIEPNDWTHLTYRLASVAGAGTLAAYFARQAGQHRRIYNWAKSLEVQLLSFPAFIAPLREEERTEAYRALARRILSSPPEKGSDSSEDSVGAAQLVDLATTVAKRAQ